MPPISNGQLRTGDDGRQPRKRMQSEREPSLTIDYSFSFERWRALCAGSAPVRLTPYIAIKCRSCDHHYKFDAPPAELNKNGTRTRGLIAKYQSFMRSHSWNKHGVLDRAMTTGIVILGEE